MLPATAWQQGVGGGEGRKEGWVVRWGGGVKLELQPPLTHTDTRSLPHTHAGRDSDNRSAAGDSGKRHC